MKTSSILIISLTLTLAYTAIKLTQARHEIRHLEAIHTATVEECAEAWLKLPSEIKITDCQWHGDENNSHWMKKGE